MIDTIYMKDPAHRPVISTAIATWVAAIALLAGACSSEASEPKPTAVASSSAAQPLDLDNAGFRDGVIAFVRQVAAGNPYVPCTLPSITTPLHVVVSMHAAGQLVGRAISTQDDLCEALTQATRQAVAAAGLAPERVAQARFAVELTHHKYGIIEYEGEGLELVGGQVPVRVFDKAMLRQRIDAGKAYLLRVMDPHLGGVHKYYYAPTDTFDDRLHTIYTASTIYTLLALYEHDHDETLREPIDRAAGFLLSMQRVAPGQPGHGGFSYSMDRTRRQPEPRFVVGTTSKTIFTLIELHKLTGDQAYLDAARLGADWLMTMQGLDGRVSAELHLTADGTWKVIEKESLLYTGQVLSALSRLYEATADHRYLEAASRTAAYLSAKVEAKGCYLGDDFRPANPISSSWTILSLFDFARASDDPALRANVYACADDLLKRQINEPTDVYRHGRWSASLSSSGNGWLAEVLSELYLDCPDTDPDKCGRYRSAVVMLFRLLMQHTYTPENSFVIQNPEMANGGLFWNALERYVRTDSVCHAMNAYVFMIDHVPDGVLVELPEPPFDALLHSR
ncbi:terpene cyclase [Enhygromyxa salina]|uniref:Uncharacterized protein n=1 Tax=Enhygromyxa salina TaxID=215803 RepID=A0A2S9XTW2_9BACT|nr:terpene cyclase [Enhygromyxa salina]PRP96274.1 hypothetical protein ENSA7_70890 [Enhygromyxa salina]